MKFSWGKGALVGILKLSLPQRVSFLRVVTLLGDTYLNGLLTSESWVSLSPDGCDWHGVRKLWQKRGVTQLDFSEPDTSQSVLATSNWFQDDFAGWMIRNLFGGVWAWRSFSKKTAPPTASLQSRLQREIPGGFLGFAFNQNYIFLLCLFDAI